MKLYHNPRCSKSRQALTLLRDAGHSPEIVQYLKHPVDFEGVLKKLGSPYVAHLRKAETAFYQLGLEGASDAHVIAALRTNPILLERPVLETETQAVVGRPPEKVMELV